MFTKEIYTARRQQLQAGVGNGLILLPGNDEVGMNYRHNTYHFRQDSTFLYYAGIKRPGLVFILDVDNNKEIILGNEPTIDDIVWTGPLETLQQQAEKAGITQTAPVSALQGILDKAIAAGQTIHYTPPYRADATAQLSEWLKIPYLQVNSKASVTLIKAIVAQRSIKADIEIAEIEKGVNTTAAMQLAAIAASKEGVTETEVAGILQGIAISAGGNLSFPTILTVNGQILHNHYSQTIMRKGQMALCDCGAETAMGYAGDLTRTFPVGKSFTAQQREVHDIVLQAQLAAIEALKPGVLFRDVHFVACEKLVDGLKALGLMHGDSKEAVAAGAHTLFFQCGLGHMLGMDVHDMENLGEPYVGYTEELTKSTEFGLKSLRLGRALEPGFTVTIEPGIYVIPELIDMWQAKNHLPQFINYDKVNAFRNFGGIRIEDDFLITASGSKLLGNPVPKTWQEMEGLK
ncbi:Xaa-Pro aminopeptidase [Filimonas lacunae]|uniref:Xaa-Pro aminopeptidase n=1 Tax=Filimonas lacunae TaxID=477680 RepID=A0A173MQX7_9BACT|nr:aminopeptidase P family protein [Filimonas lacunae]BAV10062.1 Xaa-Pro aminopeptidase [Filimonas lacunae]SIS83408.1 Xaa-Pro aminopeptidase [Filimonas lacunae]